MSEKKDIHEHVHSHEHDQADHVHTHEHTHTREQDGTEYVHSHEHVHTHENDGADHVHTHEHTHTHDHDGAEHVHSHGGHGHTHTHKHTKSVINRLARAEGHLNKVKRMVENGEDCSQVLIQLSAVISALKKTGTIILEDHIDTCIVDAVKCGDRQAIDDIRHAIEKFVK